MAHDREVDLLEALLSGQADPSDAPNSLAALATLASNIREHSEVQLPDENFRLDLRAALITQPPPALSLSERVRDRIDTATARWRYSARVAMASAVASSLIGTTGVAAAAQAALPGELLYPIKTFTEDARLAFAWGDAAEARLHLGFARERLSEVEDGVDKLSPTQLRDTLGQMDVESAIGAEQLLTIYLNDPSQAILDEVAAFTTTQRERLIAVTELVPLTVVSAAEESLEVLRRIDLQAESAVTGVLCSQCGASINEIEPFNFDESAFRPRIVLPGDGPAVTSPSCNCVDLPTTPLPREEPPVARPDPQPEPDSQPDPQPEPEPQPEPTIEDEPGGPISDLTDTLDDAGIPAGEVTELVDDLLTELGVDNPIDPIDQSLGGIVSGDAPSADDQSDEPRPPAIDGLLN